MRSPGKYRAFDKATNTMICEGYAVLGETTLFKIIEQYLVENSLGRTLLDRLGDVVQMACTGMQDVFKTDIYEDDIVLTQPYSNKPYAKKKKFKRHLGIVYYDVSMLAAHPIATEISLLTSGASLVKYYGAGWNVRIEDEQGFSCCNFGPFYECQVMGNIHENPDLIGKIKHYYD